MTLTLVEPAWMQDAIDELHAYERQREEQAEAEQRLLRRARTEALREYVERILGVPLPNTTEWFFDQPEVVVDGYRFRLDYDRDAAEDVFLLAKRCQFCRSLLTTSNPIEMRMDLAIEKERGEFRPGPYQCPDLARCQPGF